MKHQRNYVPPERCPPPPPIPKGSKGLLRFDWREMIWKWVDPGPYLSVVVLNTGQFRVNRVKL